MKKYAFIFMFAVVASMYVACQSDNSQQVSDSKESGKTETGSTTENEVKKPKLKIVNTMGVLPPELFAQKVEDPNITLIDLRTSGEIAETGMIKGAKQIDFEAGGVEEKFAAFQKDAPIMVYCASGDRSHEAYLMLQKMGFNKVYDLNGGMEAWLRKRMPVVKAN